jgi:hypothetical protein
LVVIFFKFSQGIIDITKLKKVNGGCIMNNIKGLDKIVRIISDLINLDSMLCLYNETSPLILMRASKIVDLLFKSKTISSHTFQSTVLYAHHINISNTTIKSDVRTMYDFNTHPIRIILQDLRARSAFSFKSNNNESVFGFGFGVEYDLELFNDDDNPHGSMIVQKIPNKCNRYVLRRPPRKKLVENFINAEFTKIKNIIQKNGFTLKVFNVNDTRNDTDLFVQSMTLLFNKPIHITLDEWSVDVIVDEDLSDYFNSERSEIFRYLKELGTNFSVVDKCKIDLGLTSAHFKHKVYKNMSFAYTHASISVPLTDIQIRYKIGSDNNYAFATCSIPKIFIHFAYTEKT